jgi:hypothetical protein
MNAIVVVGEPLRLISVVQKRVLAGVLCSVFSMPRFMMMFVTVIIERRRRRARENRRW